LATPDSCLRLDARGAGRPDDRAIEGARNTPLTAEQRQRLAIAARRAYAAQDAVGIVDGETFDAWRHRTVREATGRAGLTALTQRDYGPMMARLIELAGGSPRRRDWHAAVKPARRDDADRARHALQAECADQAAAFGGPAQAEAYATSLLARIHKTDWMGATARQLWQVLFTLRNRARARNRPGCPARPLSPEPCLEPCEAREAASPRFPGPSRASWPATGSRESGVGCRKPWIAPIGADGEG
jgi:hypothetical protein